MKRPIAPEHATQFKLWLEQRGGIYLWKSANLSNLGASWYSPAKNDKGEPYGKPTWQAKDTPTLITDINEFEVVYPKEVKRIRIALKMGDSFNITLTTASSARLRRAMAKFGNEAWYAFEDGEAVIYVPNTRVPLKDWKP